MILEKEKNKIIHIVLSVIPDAKIFLFGSYASGNARDDSDIDIAISSKSKISRFEIAEILNMIEASRIAKKVDIVDLDNIEADFKKEIKSNMVIWKN